MTEIEVEVSPQVVSIELVPEGQFSIDSDQYIPTRPKGIDYEGSYEVTPTRETQVLRTSGRLMVENLTVNPIPSNYGLITYSGNILTVS